MSTLEMMKPKVPWGPNWTRWTLALPENRRSGPRVSKISCRQAASDARVGRVAEKDKESSHQVLWVLRGHELHFSQAFFLIHSYPGRFLHTAPSFSFRAPGFQLDTLLESLKGPPGSSSPRLCKHPAWKSIGNLSP